MRIRTRPGVPGSAHPLLSGPGLVVVNNGIFLESDYKAILRFGLNEKAAEPATIGKFGLGMKSVFHFAEAFLVMAEMEGSAYREIVSPWGEDFHSDWGLLEVEWGQLRDDALSGLCGVPHRSYSSYTCHCAKSHNFGYPTVASLVPSSKITLVTQEL